MNQKYFSDIYSQPDNWISCLSYCQNEGYDNLVHAVEILKACEKIYIVGIGASYNAGMALKHYLRPYLKCVELCEASEFLYQSHKASEKDGIVFLSRSGKSIELVKIIECYKDCSIKTVAICNDMHSPLVKNCTITLFMHSAFDHNISVNTYTSMLCIALAIKQLFNSQSNFHHEIEKWKEEIQQVNAYTDKINEFLSKSHFIQYSKYFYLLGRNENFISASATALLFEEGAKKPSVPKYTSSFRHGTQEVISEQLAILIWLEEHSSSFTNDLKLIEDLRYHKVEVLSISNVTLNDGKIDLELQSFQYINLLIKHIIGQLCVYHLAVKNAIDTDQFLFCNYIVEHEGGL